MNKYIFKVGYFEPRQKCTVKAKDKQESFSKCRSVMDRRYEKSDREPPVGWDLEIIEEIEDV